MKCDELKAYRIIQGDTGGYGAPSYKCDTDGNRIEEWQDFCEVYDKSEADKLISELKDKCQMHDFFWEGCGFAKRGFENSIAVNEAYEFFLEENKQLKESLAELKKQVHEYALGLYVMQAKAEKEARHQKYKRCLAMAYVEWFKSMVLCNHPEGILFRRAVRRERKWKELAEQFREAK